MKEKRIYLCFSFSVFICNVASLLPNRTFSCSNISLITTFTLIPCTISDVSSILLLQKLKELQLFQLATLRCNPPAFVEVFTTFPSKNTGRTLSSLFIYSTFINIIKIFRISKRPALLTSSDAYRSIPRRGVLPAISTKAKTTSRCSDTIPGNFSKTNFGERWRQRASPSTDWRQSPSHLLRRTDILLGGGGGCTGSWRARSCEKTAKEP